MIFSKKHLAVTLSRLEGFERPSFRLEQYATDSEVAADILWAAYQNGDIEGKTIADLGCGTGILGVGAMLFSTEKMYFVDIDDKQLRKLETNLKLFDMAGEYEVVLSDISGFNKKVDTVLQNPPFGVKNAHADKAFLEKAFKISNVVYSIHKIESGNFIDKFSRDSGFKVTHLYKYDFPLKNTMHFHTSRIRRIAVGCWRLEKLL